MENTTIRPQDASRLVQESLPEPTPRRPRQDIRVAPVESSTATAFEPTLLGQKQAGHAKADNIETLTQITDDLNRFFSEGKGIRFQISPDTHNLVVQVIDRASEKVIRSIPPERLVSLRDNFEAISSGILLDNEA